MRVRKMLLCVMFIVLGLWALDALADYPSFTDDLRLVEKGVCKTEKRNYPCLILEDSGTRYMIFFDGTGEIAIFILAGEDIKFIWARNSI